MMTLRNSKPRKDQKVLDAGGWGASELVFFSFRYFLGRRSIATYSFAIGLAKAFPHLDKREQELILKELEQAFERDESDPDWNVLGGSLDRTAWERVLAVARKWGVEK